MLNRTQSSSANNHENRGLFQRLYGRLRRRRYDQVDQTEACRLTECGPTKPQEAPVGLERQTSQAPSLSFAEDGKNVPTLGEIVFYQQFGYEQQGHPFMRVSHDVAMESVFHTMEHDWKINKPRIVLLVLTNVGPIHTWRNVKQLDNFRKGLVKAANTTDMWIVTPGLNIGVSKVIGDAISSEHQKREAFQCTKFSHRHQKSTVSPLTVIGIMREDYLTYSASIEGKSGRVEIENAGNLYEENRYELNTDHSHFIVVKDNTINKTGLNHFMTQFQQHLINTHSTSVTTVDSNHKSKIEKSLANTAIPVIGLVLQGGYECARMVLECLKKNVPVVVIRGSGGLADVLAYTYRSIHRRNLSMWDAEYVENFLKPELSQKIAEHFPQLRENNLARNIFRDRILECVRHSEKNNQSYLTILNTHSFSYNLENLGEYLLGALFKSQQPDHNWNVQMQRDLILTMDWNSPGVAISEVFRKDPTGKLKVEKTVFEQALLRNNRENFVDLFLEKGFQLHSYLTPKRLMNLFLHEQNQEFFRTVCWEGVLGHGTLTRLGKNFLESDLNWLIAHLTDVSCFIITKEMEYNSILGMYVTDVAGAERKALATLSIWAVVTNRPKLAKLLWKHSDEPIHLALTISMMYDRLHYYVHDSQTRSQMEDLSRQFSEMAVGILEASYNEQSCRAYDVLSKHSPEWGYKSAVDIAATANNRRFMSHTCCQKWLTNLFFGKIRLREVSWGVLGIPEWVKVLLSAFLIFPMYIWVQFKEDDNPLEDAMLEVEEDRDDIEGEQDGLIRAEQLPHQSESHGYILRAAELTADGVAMGYGQVRTLIRDRELFLQYQPPLWKMVFLMWSAPVTKFWTFQVFYMIYLGLFSLAVLWPSCGNAFLDISVCIWTGLIVLENIRRSISLYRKYISVPLFMKGVEILLISAFLALYVLTRIFHFHNLVDVYHGKVILCCGLLYFYFRLIAIYLPISPTLGPLLYRVKLMVLVDFTNFMRMTMLVIISGGIVIQVVLYPDWPLELEMFRQAFHRAWFSMFLTPVDELTPKAVEGCLAINDTDMCWAGRFENHRCPNTGLWPYLFSIQYFVLLKLILLTLLYALFSATASKLVTETDSIWRFQRYRLVMDFVHRLRLPAPFSIISFALLFLEFIYDIITCKYFRNNDSGPPSEEFGPTFTQHDYTYWRNQAKEYAASLDRNDSDAVLLKFQADRLMTITDDMEYEKAVLRTVKGRLRELERMTNQALVHLEHLKHISDKKADRAIATSIHMLSRLSPYPGTRVQRFPVPDKFVPWEVLWVEYDPVAYTRPKSDFPNTMQPFVDDDILAARLSQTTQPIPVFQWNTVFVNPVSVAIDRQSWMLGEDGQTLIFKLSSEGVPRNPMGRTGMQGRGSLPRWGPNHYILVVITRWLKTKVALIGRKGLEFVVVRTERRDQFAIPGGFVPDDAKYNVMKALFKPNVTSDESWNNKDDMIEFFLSCQVKSDESPDDESQQLKCDMIHRGYMDDPWNTDHAWREVELWHVHYPGSETIADKLQPRLGWRLISEDVFIKLPAGQSVLLQEVTHKLDPAIL